MSIWRILQLIGAACIVLVILTRIAEALHLIPGMSWGQPSSAGHYLNLSAIIGLAALLLGGGAISQGNVPIRHLRSTKRRPRGRR
jgi:hypothetical protein